MASQKGQVPNEAQRQFVHGGHGMRKDALRRAHQIASERQQNPYEREQPRCVSCLAPRDRKSFPVCESCTTRREAGLR